MSEASYRVVTAAERADLGAQAGAASEGVYPEFLLHEPWVRQWGELYALFPEYQFALVDAGGEPAAFGNSVPLAWEGAAAALPQEGWDWAMESGIVRGTPLDSHGESGTGRRATVLCALQVLVPAARRGRGIAEHAVRAMKRLARDRGLRRLIVPVRPIWKGRYPLTPMARYARWRNAEGLPFDPWLRVHLRVGGRIGRVCARSMMVTGTVAEWEQWTGMAFPESGRYLVPGGLAPMAVDREADRGVYVEANVWVVHEVGEG